MMLDQLNVNQTATIICVRGEKSFRRRLLELGMVPNTLVRLVSIAPLGDPLNFSIRGCHISIRRSEASNIIIHIPQ